MKIGAGFIIYKIQNEKIKFFVLYKKNNQIDLPKGGFDKNIDNNLLDTALRETYEESSLNITRNNILFNAEKNALSRTFKNLTFFIAKYDGSEPEIKRNPITNVFEHNSFDWLYIEDILYNAPNYLIKPVLWAFKQIKSLEDVKNNGKTTY